MNTSGPQRNPKARQTRFARRGFSIVEMVATLAILAIVATAVASSVLQRLRRAARETETANMTGIAGALRSYIQLTRTLPAETNWPRLIAAEMSASEDRVRRTSAAYERVFALDPSIRIGSAGRESLPYVQGLAGLTGITNARVLILSSLDAELPQGAMTTQMFTNIWNTTDGSMPTSLVATHQGSAEGLRIERLDLKELFHRVILTNLERESSPVYSIDSMITRAALGAAATAPTQIDRWYLGTTPINLHYPDGALQARELLHNDLSYVFETGRWTRYLTHGRSAAVDPTSIIERFLSAQAQNSGAGPVRPQDVVQEFMMYLSTYASWAAGGAGFSGSAGGTVDPTLRALRDSQQRLDDFTASLLP